MKATLIAAALLLAAISTPAEAKRFVVLAPECGVSMPCEGGYYSTQARKYFRAPFGTPLQNYQPQRIKKQIGPVRPVREAGSVLGGRPSGCPHAYCGCSASLYLFGKIIPELNLAANWVRKFPRTSPASRMAAARPGHVMVLVEPRGGDTWLVHDGNSGRGLTRLHVRSIRGYTVVNPNV